MTTLLLRISHIADSEGITITSLEKSIGASKGVLSRAIKNNTDIQAKWIEAIAHIYPRYSCLWLLTGKGNIYVSSVEEDKNGDNYQQGSLCPNSSFKDDNSSLSIALLELLQRKDSFIVSQAEEIGRLKAENERLKEECTNTQRNERGQTTADDYAVTA